MRIPLAVAAGGAVGAVARYLLTGLFGPWSGGGIPLGTLAANGIGSFLLGVFIEVTALVWSPSPELRALLAVGLMGAFTTFSTFSLETVLLFEQGDAGLAALYVLLSVVLSLAGLFAGMRLFRVALT